MQSLRTGAASSFAERRRAEPRADGRAVHRSGTREALTQQARHPPADLVDTRVRMMHPRLARAAVEQPGRGRRVGARRRLPPDAPGRTTPPAASRQARLRMQRLPTTAPSIRPIRTQSTPSDTFLVNPPSTARFADLRQDGPQRPLVPTSPPPGTRRVTRAQETSTHRVKTAPESRAASNPPMAATYRTPRCSNQPRRRPTAWPHPSKIRGQGAPSRTLPCTRGAERARTPRRHARCSSAARRRHAPRRRSWKPACPRRRGPPTSRWTPSTASAWTGNPSCERTGRPQDALRVRLPARGHAPGWRNPEVPVGADPATVEEAPGRYHRERGSAGNGALTAGAERKHAPSGTRNRHAPGEACQTTADRRRAEHTS